MGRRCQVSYLKSDTFFEILIATLGKLTFRAWTQKVKKRQISSFIENPYLQRSIRMLQREGTIFQKGST